MNTHIIPVKAPVFVEKKESRLVHCEDCNRDYSFNSMHGHILTKLHLNNVAFKKEAVRISEEREARAIDIENYDNDIFEDYLSEEEDYTDSNKENNNKFVLVNKKTQSGKTFEAIRLIETDMIQEEGRSIHLIHTMNTILSNDQFARRLDFLEKKYGKGSVVIFNSSSSNSSYKHISTVIELKGLCIDKKTCPRIVVMCSNHSKFDDCYEFVKTVNDNPSVIDKISITFDELHVYISNNLREKIEKLNDMDKVYRILALTATPENLFTEDKEGFFSEIQTLLIDDTTNENYIGYDQMNIFNTDDLYKANNNTKSVEYQKNVLEKYPTILCENSRTFIPSGRECRTHNLIKNMIFELNKKAVVVVINGTDKRLYYYNDNNTLMSENLIHHKKESSETNSELSETISSLIIKYKLQNRPYVMTGLNCVGMGQTLTHKDTGSFTSAIFGHSKLSNTNTYQLAGRVTGIMKHWPTHCKTDVYAPTLFLNKWSLMEQCVENMHSEENNGKKVTLEKYNIPKVSNKQQKPKIPEDFAYQTFDTEQQSIEFGETMGHTFTKAPKAPKAPKTLLDGNGNNPTEEYVISRKWGLGGGKDGNSTMRRVITNLGKFCVYWKPSLFKKN